MSLALSQVLPIISNLSAKLVPNLTIENIAELCHIANTEYCKLVGDPLADWSLAKDSAVAGVTAHLTNEMTPEKSHQLWYDFKEAKGWVYGEEKDFDKKTHPCMVPYDQLPESQQAKDYLFAAVVNMCKPFMAKNVFLNGDIDGRQSDDVNEEVSLFRPRYRALTAEEKDLHDAIKAKADELADLIYKVKYTTNTDLAIQHLEDSVYRAVKGLTA
jgi:hypothetical protein